MSRFKKLLSADDSGWGEVEFQDHAGRPARSCWLQRPDEEDRRPPDFSLQIYFTHPPSESFATIIEFFTDTIGHTGRFNVRWDFYEPLPDLPACVDHQRLEIAYRQALDPQARSIHPIPKYPAARREGKGCDGFLILLTADTFNPDPLSGLSYQPDNPLWVYFQRTTRTCTIKRSDLEDPRADDIEDLDDDDPRKYFREMLDMYFYRHYATGNIPSDLWLFCIQSAMGGDESNYVYDFDIDSKIAIEHDTNLTYSKDLPDSSNTDLLSRKSAFNLSVESTRPPGSSTDGVLVTNSTGNDIPSLRYLVYLNFQRPPNTELSTFGLIFTAEVLERLPPDTTAHFEFFPTPPSSQQNHHSRLQRILNDTRAQLDARQGFTIGGLQPAGDRAFPVTRTAWDARLTSNQPYTTFSVVLDSADFVYEPNVLFALRDGGDTVRWGESLSKDELEVWRSTGMDAVAERLRYENGLKYVVEPLWSDICAEFGFDEQHGPQTKLK